MVNRRYSKGSGFYFTAKDNFFSENSQHLDAALSANACYTKQQPRTSCKLCTTPLTAQVDFQSHGVEYSFCRSCSHLNGRYDDSESFVHSLYVEHDGKHYAANYINDGYIKRVSDIYKPKIDFFIESNATSVQSILDVGCGAGHFVYACRDAGIDAVGYDVNAMLVSHGNTQIKNKFGIEPLEVLGEDGLYQKIEEAEVDAISALAIFEHLREPHRFFEAFRRSKAKFLFYSVPMFSLSVVIENVFPRVFPRHLSAGHTQLFTEGSLSILNQKLGVEPVAEWRFGTDAMDLYRSLSLSVESLGCSEYFLKNLSDCFKPCIDKVQAVLDEHHYCSQIHCMAQKI